MFENFPFLLPILANGQITPSRVARVCRVSCVTCRRRRRRCIRWCRSRRWESVRRVTALRTAARVATSCYSHVRPPPLPHPAPAPRSVPPIAMLANRPSNDFCGHNGRTAACHVWWCCFLHTTFFLPICLFIYRANIRKLIYMLILCIEKSNNCIIRAILDSDIWFHSRLRRHWMPCINSQSFA